MLYHLIPCSPSSIYIEDEPLHSETILHTSEPISANVDEPHSVNEPINPSSDSFVQPLVHQPAMISNRPHSQRHV